MEVNVTQIVHTEFPIIECYVLVRDNAGNTLPNLDSDNFQITEQSNLESWPTQETPIDVDYVSFYSGVTLALLIDRSGSMRGQPIIDAKNAANAFIDDNLRPEDGDRAAIVTFGSPAQFHDPPGFTSDKNALHNVIDPLTATGFTALYGAIYEAVTEINRETGIKAVIVFTDGYSEQDTHTKEQAIELAKNSNVAVYTIALRTEAYAGILREIATETGGFYTYAPTASDLEDIYNDIADKARAQYLLAYTTHNPNYDNTIRTVTVKATVGADSAQDTGTYAVGTVPSAPQITLHDDTKQLMSQSQWGGDALTIKAWVTDDVSLQTVRLFYRTTGSGTAYNEEEMSITANGYYQFPILGADVVAPGLDFYITASDGMLTATSPTNAPAFFPHQIAVLPNHFPAIAHTPVTNAPAGEPVTIEAEITDADTGDYVDEAWVYYRQGGHILYDRLPMGNTAGNHFEIPIPRTEVTGLGVDYYIMAADSHGVRAYHGTDMVPHHILVTVNQPPDTKIETADIDSSNGTAKFTWSGSDDSTPSAQLVYKHRLLNPDSPLYDWSDWSSNTTATYPRPPDSRLPDGTYRFQVKAKDADEAIQPDSAVWKFTIERGEEWVTGFWVRVTNTPLGTWRVREGPGTTYDVVKRVPNEWVLWVVNTHQDLKTTDGYVWWEVADSLGSNSYWMAAKNVSSGEVYLERADGEAAKTIISDREAIIPTNFRFEEDKELTIGMKDDNAIRFLQMLLTAEGPDVYPERMQTGYYGDLTEAAVKKFQTKYNLEVTGTVNKPTAQMLNVLLANKYALGTNRVTVALEAVNHYYANRSGVSSLYSSNDGSNDFSSIFTDDKFPEELILAMIIEESQKTWGRLTDSPEGLAISTEYDNPLVTVDGGYGLMQITYPENRGKGSGLELYKEEKHRLRYRKWKGEYTQEYWSDYYANTKQGIYANIKDGLRVLQDMYELSHVITHYNSCKAYELCIEGCGDDEDCKEQCDHNDPADWGKCLRDYDISCEEMRWISAVQRYNQGTTLLAHPNPSSSHYLADYDNNGVLANGIAYHLKHLSQVFGQADNASLSEDIETLCENREDIYIWLFPL